MYALRFSFVLPSGYASRGSKYDRASKFSAAKDIILYIGYNIKIICINKIKLHF